MFPSTHCFQCHVPLINNFIFQEYNILLFEKIWCIIVMFTKFSFFPSVSPDGQMDDSNVQFLWVVKAVGGDSSSVCDLNFQI